MTIVEELRNKQSTYNRKLLDKAANVIERLETENRRFRQKERESSPDTVWICVYKDTLGFRDSDDNLTTVCLPTRWLRATLKEQGISGFEPWLETYTADETESIITKAMREGVIVSFDEEWMETDFDARHHVFEGKRCDNGEWIYGRLIADNVIAPMEQGFNLAPTDHCILANIVAHCVKPETVSEFPAMYGKKLVVESSEEEDHFDVDAAPIPDFVFEKLSPLMKEIYLHQREYGKIIPEKYMCRGTYEEGGTRTWSPIGYLLSPTKLDDIYCPCCEEQALRIGDFGPDSMFPDFRVTCDACGYTCPCGSEDYGETVAEFKTWMEAFLLLGAPRDRLDEDLSLLFFPEEWRNAIIAERENEK